MINEYSVFSAVIFFNIAIIAVYVLMRRTKFVIKHTASSLMLLTFLATVRLLIPADTGHALLIESSVLIPAVQKVANAAVFKTGFTVGAVFCCIWGLGTICALGYDIWLLALTRSEKRVLRCVSNDTILRCAESMGIRYPIKISSSIAEPYMAGIFKPTIYMPDWDMSEKETKLVLSHELQHIYSHDALKKLVFLLIEAVFWWNPVVHIFRREFNQLLEIHCDSKLTENKSDADRLQYAETLLAAMRRVTGGHRDMLGVSTFTNSQENMMQRFELILADSKPGSKTVKILFGLLLVVVFLLSYFVLFQPYYEFPIVSVDGADVADIHNLFILDIESEYYLFSNGQLITILNYDDFDDPFISSLPVYDAGRPNA